VNDQLNTGPARALIQYGFAVLEPEEVNFGARGGQSGPCWEQA